MNYSSRASPKLRYSIIEEYGGRGHRTRLRNRSRGSTCVNLCVHGVPLASVYKGWRRRRPAKAEVRPGWGVLLGLQVLVGVHQEGRKGEGIGGEGEVAGPLFPSPIRTRGEGGAAAFFLFPVKPIKAHYFSRNYPVLRKIPESFGTFPMSEYSRPIYRSLRLDHFETPRHVPDLIRDSELLRYIKTHKLVI